MSRRGREVEQHEAVGVANVDGRDAGHVCGHAFGAPGDGQYRARRRDLRRW
jgi:hypothetical protein